MVEIEPPRAGTICVTPTHNEADGHETATRPGTLASVQTPPVGLVVVNRCPTPSTATHSDAEGQETPTRGLELVPAGSTVVRCAADTPSGPTTTWSMLGLTQFSPPASWGQLASSPPMPGTKAP